MTKDAKKMAKEMEDLKSDLKIKNQRIQELVENEETLKKINSDLPRGERISVKRKALVKTLADKVETLTDKVENKEHVINALKSSNSKKAERLEFYETHLDDMEGELFNQIDDFEKRFKKNSQ